MILPFVGHSSSTHQRSESGQSNAEPQAAQHSVEIGNILLLSSTSSSAVALFFLSVDVCISWKDTHAHKEHAKCVSVFVVATSAFCCLFTANVDHIFCLFPFLPLSLPSLHVLLLRDGDNDSCSRLPSLFSSLSLTLAHSPSVPPSLSVLAVCSTLCRIWYHRIPISV